MRAAQTWSKWAVASALAAAHLFALAQQPAAMNFKQVYEAALEQDATIRASRAAADSGRERLPQAKAALMPQISASAGRSNNNLDTTAPNILGNLSTTNDKYFSDSKTVQLRQPLMNMQRWFQFQQAKSIVESRELARGAALP
jgi:outer membrane protein/protease secretion system outer membrane protein